MNKYLGIDIHVSDLLPKKAIQVQTKFPRSKKRRIQKKWTKRYTVTKYEDQAFIWDNKLVMSSVMEKYLKNASTWASQCEGSWEVQKPLTIDKLREAASLIKDCSVGYNYEDILEPFKFNWRNL